MTRNSTTLILVHGIGGPRPVEDWLDPLNAGLSWLGYPIISTDTDRIVTVDYMEALRTGDIENAPPRLWAAPDDRERQQAWASLLLRREVMAEWIESVRTRPRDLTLAWASDSTPADWVASLIDHIRHYRATERRRNAVWSSVLAQIPASGDVILIGHSLGSVVLLDLLKRLPQALRVRLLLTVAAPMGVSALRRHHDGLDDSDHFPADRVESWVNVYDPGDVVTVGKGAAPYFPAALDAPVHTGSSHSLRAYMGHPVAAAAIGMSAFGPVPSRQDHLPARQLSPQWDPLLLRFAFTHEIWATCPSDEWRQRQRIDLARRLLSQRAVEETQTRHATLQAQADALDDGLREHMLRQLADSPVAPGHAPTQSDLWRNAAELMRDTYTDDQLVIASIDLLLSPPLAPFGVKISSDRAKTALGDLLQRIRRDTAEISGRAFATAIADAIKDAKGAVEEGSFPWTEVLLGAGILVLAATGVGLVVAAPAGLAGAAAITATLATFGPGGMAGGVATLAVLSGTSMALTTAGLAAEKGAREQFAEIQGAMATELAHLPSQAFRTAVAGLLAIVGARHRLGLEPDAASVESVLLTIQATTLHEVGLHRAVAPDTDATKDWRRKAAIVDKALRWLAKQGPEIARQEIERADFVKQLSAEPETPPAIGN